MPARLDKTIGTNTSHQYWPHPSANVINRIVTGQAMVAATASPVLEGFSTGATVRGFGIEGTTGAALALPRGCLERHRLQGVGRGAGLWEVREQWRDLRGGPGPQRAVHPLVELPCIQPALGEMLLEVPHRTVTVGVTDPRVDATPVRGVSHGVEAAGSTAPGSEEVGSLTAPSISPAVWSHQVRRPMPSADGKGAAWAG